MNLWFDIQYAARNLLKSLSFSLLTICVMAIGLGSSIFVTSVVKHLAWDPIYFPDGDRVINIRRRINDEWRQTLLHDYQKIKDEVKSIDLVSGHYTTTAIVSDGFQSVRYRGTVVTGDFFKITGVTPLVGRELTEKDQVPGSLPVVMLSYNIWQNHFSRRQDIVGQTIQINNNNYEVVGIATKESAHPLEKTLWLPMQKNAHELTLSNSVGLNALNARLRPGKSVAQARDEINRVFSNSPDLLSDSEQKIKAIVFSEKRSRINSLINILYIMLTASLCILFLCCINVGNLLLTRSNSKLKETAIRLALGASRKKLISQIMWETVFICSIGGLLAILLAGWGIDATMEYFLNRYQVFEFPKHAVLSLGWHDVLIGGAITLLSIFFTGFIPAWRSSNCEFNAVLKDGSKTSLGKKSGKISKSLVGVQIAISCILLSAAGVLFTLIQQGIAAGYGVPIERYISGTVNPISTFYPWGQARVAYFDRILEQVNTLPGVEQATLISRVPTQWAPAKNIEPDGAGWTYNDFVRSNVIVVYPNAFDTLDIPLLEGRQFHAQDKLGSPKVAIISHLLANKLWPNESPIGKRLRGYAGAKNEPDEWKTVVGVVPQISQNEMFDDNPTPNVYVPYRQQPADAMAIVLKTRGDPGYLKAPLEEAVLKVDPNIPIYRSFPLKVQDEHNRAFPDFIKRVFGIFAIAALVMAATGIYGMMSNHIRRRTQEIGIRRALGTPDSTIARLIIRQSASQLLVGFSLGIPLGYVVSRIFIDKYSTGSPLYIAVYFVVPLLISAVVLLATITPLLSVLRQSPATALRYE